MTSPWYWAQAGKVPHGSIWSNRFYVVMASWTPGRAGRSGGLWKISPAFLYTPSAELFGVGMVVVQRNEWWTQEERENSKRKCWIPLHCIASHSIITSKSYLSSLNMMRISVSEKKSLLCNELNEKFCSVFVPDIFCADFTPRHCRR